MESIGGSTFCLTPHEQHGYHYAAHWTSYGLTDLLAWINGASESLHVHMYLLHEVHLVEAHQRSQSGVDVNVVLDYGDSWWNQYDLDTHRGMATTLLAAGIDVMWFGDTEKIPTPTSTARWP